MSDELQRQQIGKTSPVKKAGYAAIFATALGIVLPFAFGINTFAWIASWMVENWPRLIIIAGFTIYMAKSHMSG